jgi:hypothetical protein
MKIRNIMPDKFRILFYNSKFSPVKVNDSLNRYGFRDFHFITAENDFVNTTKGLEPEVIVINQVDCNDSNVPALLTELRKTHDTPVIIWCENMSEFTTRKLLSFRHTYILNLSDGFISLIEILQRIEMKTKNPKLWV